MAGQRVFHYSIPILQETGNGQFEEGDSIDSAKTLINHTCVLVSKLNPRKGTVCIASPQDEHLTVSSGELIPLIPRDGLVDYVHYTVQSSTYRDRLASTVESATRSHQRAGVDDVIKFYWAFPSTNEQHAIVAFLNRETAKLDALMAEQERLIALLQEKRQAVISHAVTKGLDPNVPMKESGVDWLGAIPAHWEVKRLKYLADAITGLTYSPADVVADGQGTLVLRSSNVQGGAVILDDNVFVSCDIPAHLRTRSGDILICSRNGSRALIGKNAVITESAAGLTWGAFMTVVRSTQSDYLACVFNSPLFEHQSGAFLTSTINQLTIGTLNGFAIPFPPHSERAAISEFIKHESSRLDSLAESAITTISLLRERRTALITAAVTGKIDVRGLAETAA
jgi:type I restriction enzyme S subunit